MKVTRNDLIEASRKQFESIIEKHRINIEIYLENSVGIGEHPDIMGAIESELAQMAEYDDKLEMLNKYFGD